MEIFILAAVQSVKFENFNCCSIMKFAIHGELFYNKRSHYKHDILNHKTNFWMSGRIKDFAKSKIRYLERLMSENVFKALLEKNTNVFKLNR